LRFFGRFNIELTNLVHQTLTKGLFTFVFLINSSTVFQITSWKFPQKVPRQKQ
jgi:hypothetical protein